MVWGGMGESEGPSLPPAQVPTKGETGVGGLRWVGALGGAVCALPSGD